jgi:hypothetical protein
MEGHAYPGDHQVKGVRKLLGQLVVAKNPFAEGKWIVIISGISGPATLGIAQMLTGCMYKEFTINNLQSVNQEEKTVIESAVSDCRGVLGEGNPQTPSDVGRVPYDALSEHMLSKLLKVAGFVRRRTSFAPLLTDVCLPDDGTTFGTVDIAEIHLLIVISTSECFRRQFINVFSTEIQGECVKSQGIRTELLDFTVRLVRLDESKIAWVERCGFHFKIVSFR